MLAQTRVIRITRRHIVEFRCRKTPREALAALPLHSPAANLDPAHWAAKDCDAQPGRDRLGLAY